MVTCGNRGGHKEKGAFCVSRLTIHLRCRVQEMRDVGEEYFWFVEFKHLEDPQWNLKLYCFSSVLMTQGCILIILLSHLVIIT